MTNTKIENILGHSQDFIHGKRDRVELALCSFFSGGHLLIEDIPGVGKTSLVKYLAKVLGMDFSRIQFTSDLLPFDILGSSSFDKESGKFTFHRGPIFGEIILADELNRASGKTQSALLQAMEERSVSLEGTHYLLPENFTVMATQNPHGQIGVHPLPESQLDRFMMKIDMDYPSREASIGLLDHGSSLTDINQLEPLMTSSEIRNIRQSIGEVKVSKNILEYIQNILEESRNHSKFTPLSMRAGLDLKNAAKSWAFFHDRDYVIPDDIQDLFIYVTSHRLCSQDLNIKAGQKLAKELIDSIRVI
jgi:MoxR-like ATPase